MSVDETKKNTRPRRRITPEMLAALSAVLIGVSALFVSIYQASIMREQQRIMREQQRASVWPYLETGTNYNTSTGLRISVTNQGIGPARVESVEATVDSAVVTWWGQALSALMEREVRRFTYHTINGRVLAPEGRVSLIEIKPPLSDTLARRIERLEMQICYCSVYQECWTTAFNSLETVPVEACERDEERQFWN